ncbi:fibronectin type III domain-containing protein [Candidatus Poriferisocius sp.]|uniref:fibronectin type III domain-containing protein n=1 Tax=Candidatus Poriferisocius sp. TaxID=3101276 RepID=UPI003B021136
MKYAVRVRALNKLGAGDYTETPELTFGAPPHPGAKDVNTDDDPRVAKAPSLLALPGSLVPFDELTAYVLNAAAPIEGRDRFLKPSTVTLRLSIPPAVSVLPALDFFGLSAKTSEVGGGVDSNTRWEYSYSSGAGGFTDWTFVNVGAQFNGGTDYVVDGLVNGNFYTFRIRAINPGRPDLVGPYLETPVTIPGIPGIPPGAPLNTRVVGGDRQITVSWVPGNSGGFPLDSWQYCLYDIDEDPTRSGRQGSHTPSCTWTKIPNSNAATTSHTFTGLTNGWAYTYQIRALNVIGAFLEKLGSGAPIRTSPAVPGRPPGAPANVMVQPGNGQVTIRVTAPSDTGGNRVIGYQVRKKHSDGAYDAWETLGTTVRATSSSSSRPSAERSGAVVRNLINGAGYTFQVRARNTFGTGPEKQTTTVIPIGPPTPGQLQAEPGDRQVVLSWTLDSGGNKPDASKITGWQYRQKQANAGYMSWTDIPDSGPDTRTHTITGLSNGVTYTFQIRNLPQVSGEPSESQPATPATTPPAPQLTATPADSTVTLSWTPGTSEPAGQPGYSAPVTGWQYRTRAGTNPYGDWTNIDDSDATTTTHKVSDLTNGVNYTFEVRATNTMGNGATSTVSTTPATVPPAPQLTAIATNRSVTLSWTPGTSEPAGQPGYAAPTTGWQLRVNDGEWVDLNAETSINSVPVPNLVNGTTYTFEVRAINTIGNGATTTVSAIPATVPEAPAVTAAAADGSVVLSWSAGGDGGLPVSGWQLRINDGEWVDLDVEAVARSVLVPNLVNGLAYRFGVRAVNAVGGGSVGVVSAIPVTVPPVPEVDVVAGDGAITLSWVSTGDGGSPITGWQYRTRIGAGDYLDWVDVEAANTTVALTGLNSGTGLLAYTFQVRAINAAGNGAIATSLPIVPLEPATVGDNYYSGTITGPSFCAELSLGGPRLFPLDTNDDGIADVCSLPYTRREAIARQNAVVTLANRYRNEYTTLVNTICTTIPSDEDEACGGDELAAPGFAPADDGGPYYSGTISGPTYCTNSSLGGPGLVPLDSDGDGVADVCSLPYTRREAIARQIAGDILSALHLTEFNTTLAEECRRLQNTNHGDNSQDIGNDICAL